MDVRILPTLALLLATTSVASATTADIFGNWSRDDGAARVKVANCGSQICATNTWIKDPVKQNEKVGDRLIFTIKESNDEWAGSAYDPQRKLKFSAKLKATGQTMITTGCIVGGLICRSTHWVKN